MKQLYYQMLRTLSVRIVVAALTFVGALYFFAWMLHEAFLREEDRWDRVVFRFFEARVPEGFYPAVRVFTFFGKPHFLLPLYLVLVGYFLLRRQNEYALAFGVLGATATGLLFGLKALIGRSRPRLPIFEHLPGYSFPSGHALLSFILCGFLIYWLWDSGPWRGWKWVVTALLVLYSLLQGLSRVILRVHYATDVVAGFCLGYAWVLLNLWLYQKWKAAKGSALRR